MMNSGLGNGVHGSMTGSISHINHSMMDDDMSDNPSSPESAFDASDLMHSSMHDEVTAQLAAAGRPQSIKYLKVLFFLLHHVFQLARIVSVIIY